MHKKIICALLLLFLLFIMGIGICKPDNAKKVSSEIAAPKGTTLINNLQGRDFSMRLFYGDIAKEALHAFDLTSTVLSLEDQYYTAYTGGFMESSKCNVLLQAVNDYRSSRALDMITTFDYYIEMDGFAFLAQSDKGLDSLYRIDLASFDVTMPALDNDMAAESQTICQLTLGRNVYYLLTLNLEQHMAYWYALDPVSLEVQSCRAISLFDKISSQKQCALDSEGNVYLTGYNELLMHTKDETLHLSLSFDPDTVYYEDHRICTFAASDLFLCYAIYDEALMPIASGQANLPNKKVTLTSIYLKDGYLYTVCQDDQHPIFRNYITLYDVTTHQMVYCLALKETAGSVLLSGMPLAAIK